MFFWIFCVWNFVDFCWIFWIIQVFFFILFLFLILTLEYLNFLLFFCFFGGGIFRFFGIPFKVTKVTTKSYQCYYWTPKNAKKNGPKQHNKLTFFCPKYLLQQKVPSTCKTAENVLN